MTFNQSGSRATRRHDLLLLVPSMKHVSSDLRDRGDHGSADWALLDGHRTDATVRLTVHHWPKATSLGNVFDGLSLAATEDSRSPLSWSRAATRSRGEGIAGDGVHGPDDHCQPRGVTEIRPEQPADIDAIRELVHLAFAGHPYSSGTEPLIIDALRITVACSLGPVLRGGDERRDLEGGRRPPSFRQTLRLQSGSSSLTAWSNERHACEMSSR